jgi:hypothetical protein
MRCVVGMRMSPAFVLVIEERNIFHFFMRVRVLSMYLQYMYSYKVRESSGEF